MKYVIAGGGTGGHIYPAIAILEAIARTDTKAQFIYIGVKGKPEESIMPEYIASAQRSIHLHFIRASGLPRTANPWQFLKCALLLKISCLQSLLILFRNRPDRIVATGGFGSVPVVFAGFLLGISSYIHEQNVIPGVANKICAKFSKKVFVSFPASVQYFPAWKTMHTGYPVRQHIRLTPAAEAKRRFGFSPDQKIIFFCGGSLGARTLNEAVLTILPDLLHADNIGIIHSIGRNRSQDYRAFEETTQKLQALNIHRPIPGKYLYTDYIKDIHEAYSAADLVVARAGAGSVMEIAAVRKPSILIPKRAFRGGHQQANAQVLVEQGVATVLQEELDTQTGKELINSAALLQGIFSAFENGKAVREELFDGIVVQNAAADIASIVMNRSPFQLLEEWTLNPPAHPETYVTVLEKLYQSPDWKIRNVAVKLTGVLKTSALLPNLIACVCNRTPASFFNRMFGGDYKEVGFVRRNAVRVLAHMGARTPDVYSALLTALSDPYYEVRSEAARAGRQLFAPDRTELAEFLTRLCTLTTDRNFEVLIAAIEALGELAPTIESTGNMRALSYHTNNRVKSAVAHAYKRLHERGIISMEEYRTHLNMIFIPGGYLTT